MTQDVVKYEASKPLGSANTLSALLARPDILSSMGKIIPKHLNPERLAKMALVAASRQPKLLECTQGSILKSVMTAAQLGIDCSGVLGRGYLVPYRNKNGATEAQFIIGYLGLVDLARRGGDVQSVTAHVVYKQDKFRLVQGIEEVLEHEPDLESEKSDTDITGAYMVARFKSGGHHIEYMSRREIDSIRARSKASDSGPWRTDYSEMVRKTVVRRGCKYLPLSPDVMGMIAEADEEFEQNRPPWTEPERGVIDMDSLSPKPQEELPVEEQPEQANAFRDPDIAKYPENARKMFYARCTGKKFSEDQRHKACAELFETVGVSDWPEIQDSTKYAEIVEWINKNISAKK